VSVLRVQSVALFRTKQVGSFTCNQWWQFYVQYRLAVLRVRKCCSLRMVQGGSFTYNVGWQFYVQSMAVLHTKSVGILRETHGLIFTYNAWDSFTCNKCWQFYELHSGNSTYNIG